MKTASIRVLMILLLLMALVDCQKNTKPIVVGEEVEVTTETIGIEGGTITVSKPGDPLDGFKIEVPRCISGRKDLQDFIPPNSTASAW